MDRYEVAVLAEDYEEKCQVFRAHAMANLPTDPAAARKSMIAFHHAQADMLEAWARLERAKGLEIWK